MTEFDEKLRKKLHHYKADSGMSFQEIAKDAGIKNHSIYRFTSGSLPLNGEDVGKLLDYLGLTVELKEEK